MTSEADVISNRREKYIEALKAGDVGLICELHTDDTVWMPLNEPSLYGTGELKEWYEEYFQHFKIVTLAGTEHDLILINEWAIERWGYMVVIAPNAGGERIRDDGRFFAVWKRDADGAWRIAQSMINSIRPVGSGTSRFLARMQETKNKGMA